MYGLQPETYFAPVPQGIIESVGLCVFNIRTEFPCDFLKERYFILLISDFSLG